MAEAVVADTTPSVGTPPPSAPRRARMPIGLALLCVAIAVCFAAPFGYVVVRNLSWLGDLPSILGDEGALGPLRRSLVLATLVSVTAAVVGTTLAWLVVRTDLPGRRAWRVLAALPLVVPTFVGALALLAAFAPGGLLDVGMGRPEGLWAAYVVLSLFTYPYVYLLVAGRLSALPAPLEEVARSLGRSPLHVFRTVVLPQTAGAIGAGSLLVFLYTLSDFGAVVLLRYDTLTTRIYSSRLLDRQTSLSLSLVVALAALAVVAAERRLQRRRRLTEAVSAGRRSTQVRLGPWKPFALLVTSAVVAVALVAPVAVLFDWVAPAVAEGRLGFADVVQPAWNTVWISVVAGFAATAAVLPIAVLSVRHRTRVAGAVDLVVVSAFALPGIVIALAIVFWATRAPLLGTLYLTFPLLIVAYVVHFGSQALRASQVAVSGVPVRLHDAARSLGAGRLRRLGTVDLPLMRSGLAAGTGLVLLSTMKELPATLLLAPIGFQTLATRIFDRTEDLFYAEAGLAALVLVALSAVLTWLLTIRRMERLA